MKVKIKYFEIKNNNLSTYGSCFSITNEFMNEIKTTIK
jgi:hypothetical protein